MDVRAKSLVDRLFVEPASYGRLTLPPIGLLVLATIGGILLVNVAVFRWATPSDEHAYWLAAERLIAGLPLYDPSAFPGTPYAYWYPPTPAQILAPLTLVVPDLVFTAAWTLTLLACLLWLADRRFLVALAMIAFLPVAVELWFRNVHLVLAVLLVLGLRRSPLWWVPAIAIKVSPIVTVGYLLAARRYRDVALVGLLGSVVLAVSIALSPAAWWQFVEVVVLRGTTTGSSLIPVPFVARFAASAVLAVVAGRLGGRRGETLLVVALVVGNPTLWMTAFSLLVAVVPIWRRHPATNEAAPLT